MSRTCRFKRMDCWTWRYMCLISPGAIQERERVCWKCAFIRLCVQLLEASIRPDTSILSVMTVNNEIGVKQPIEEIGNHGNS